MAVYFFNRGREGGGDKGKSRVRHTQGSLQTSRGRYEQKEQTTAILYWRFNRRQGERT